MMEKNSMAILDEALALLKANNESTIAYAKFTGYAIAIMNKEDAEYLLKCVKASLEEKVSN